jgi:flavin reductase (DIM6/NTAB) family NADH-FMN oxidoreductase RutF
MTRLLLDPADPQNELADDFRSAMRRIGASVAIITAEQRGRRGGLTATSLCPVSVDPPTLLACVNRSAHTHRLVSASRRFGVNLLHEEQQDVAEAFAGKSGHENDDKFTGAGIWEDDGWGLPMLKGAVAFISCRVIRDISVQTHTVFIGVVERVVAGEHSRPLVYSNRSFARLSP